MLVRLSRPGQLLARLTGHANAGCTTQVGYPLQPRIAPLAGKAHMVQPSSACANCLFHRMEAIENVHTLKFTASKAAICPISAPIQRDIMDVSQVRLFP